MTEVYKAIAAVQGELAKTGISKDGVNSAQNYKFRGIDQVYAALSPLLAKHSLCVIPRVTDHQMRERITIKEWNGQKKESVLFYVTVHAEFDFVSAKDGSKHTAATYGEAMDSGDKATNKAMSAAYKYAAFMTFAIPTEGDNDADAASHEVAPKVERLGHAEISELQGMIEGYGFKVENVCKHYKINSLKEIPLEEFANVKAALNRQYDKKKKSEEPEEGPDEGDRNSIY